VSTRRPRPPWFATPEGPVSLTSVCAYHSLDGVPGLLSSAPPARPLLLTSLRQDWARQTKKKKKERTTDKTPNFGFLHAARKTLKVHGASDFRTPTRKDNNRSRQSVPKILEVLGACPYSAASHRYRLDNLDLTARGGPGGGRVRDGLGPTWRWGPALASGSCGPSARIAARLRRPGFFLSPRRGTRRDEQRAFRDGGNAA